MEHTCDNVVVVQVADGELLRLTMPVSSTKWKAYTFDGVELSSADGWIITVFSPPVFTKRTRIAEHRSFGNSAHLSSVMLASIKNNIRIRDSINTELGVFINMAKNLVTADNGTSSMPWFQPVVHGAMGSAPHDLNVAFQTKLADRLEAAIGLASASTAFREHTSAAARFDAAGKVTPQFEEKKKHTEHVVTDGFEARDVPYRRSPEEIVRIVDHYFNTIMFAYMVMPQVKNNPLMTCLLWRVGTKSMKRGGCKEIIG
jgi:hypothetical protein